KMRLVTPGPMMVPPETLLELAKPVTHHRTDETKALIAEAVDGIKKVCLTKNDVVLLTSSGTGAMEICVGNFVRPGDKAIILTAGKWGERWVELCKAYGANAIVVEEAYGKQVPPARLAAALAEHPDAVVVLSTLSETSTGVVHDVKAYGEIVAKTPALLAVDGISGVGACECRTDDWRIDLLCVGSQKALMVPPGLAFLTVSPKAKAVLETRTLPAYYFDLKKGLKAAAKNDTPFTPAHTLIGALAVSLRRVVAEGIENVWTRTDQMARAFGKALEALDLGSLAEVPGNTLTAVLVPAGVDADAWAGLLEKKYGLKTAEGQGSLKGRILRFAHMGYMDAIDVVGVVAALEWSLLELGHPTAVGKGVAAAANSLAADLVPNKTAK
ncbi:MAG: pyridoxal-phosphate-dependent aminotransferase family protein, partial [Planctomycetia bacterium]